MTEKQELKTIPGGFQIGKRYRHTTGDEMRIVGSAYTHAYGYCLVAEDGIGTLMPIGAGESHTVNFTEVQE